MPGTQHEYPTDEPREQHTVKVLLQDDDRVLLVAERGTPNDSRVAEDGSSGWKKHPGLGLPGGKVEGTLDQILDGIDRQLELRGIDRKRFLPVYRQCRKMEQIRIALTAVKEVLEETGMLVRPVSLILWQAKVYQPDTIWLCTATVVEQGSTLRGGDAKIKEVAWHSAGRLPKQTYGRTKAMVRRYFQGGRC